MKHYITIKVLPDPEFQQSLLMNALFSKLHRGLVQAGQGEIGISFPGFNGTLGDQIRLHSHAASLVRLMDSAWLKGLRDYTHLTAISDVPPVVKYRVVKRVQVKSGVTRLRRRSVRKGWMSEAEAVERIPLTRERKSKQPFLQLKSQSTGQAFRLFIEHGDIVGQAVTGGFSAYGLSGNATIPWF